ncbi:hypothetical protein CR513_56420, partial [Mucuna pruriens]
MTNPIPNPGATSILMAPQEESLALQNIIKELAEIQKQVVADSNTRLADPTTSPHGPSQSTTRGEGTLRSFIARFSNVFVKIHNLNPEVALHSMFMTLKVGLFLDKTPKEHGRLEDESHWLHPDGKDG